MLLLTNEDVEQALTPQDAIAATESIYRELAEGKALNRARSQVYLPAESREHPGFHYRMKTQEGGSLDCGMWALRITSDMAGFSYTAGVKRRRILPVASGDKYCGLVILFDVERIEPVAIMPDGVIHRPGEGLGTDQEIGTKRPNVGPLAAANLDQVEGDEFPHSLPDG